MKRTKKLLMISLIATMLFTSSCATILGGQVSDYQKTKPSQGEPKREIRAGALVADIFLTGALGVIIDFATGAIYKPKD